MTDWIKGRYDGDLEQDLRFWQVVKPFEDIDKYRSTKNICFLGFPSDKGVKSNLGRVGAAGGPKAIREKMASLPAIEGVEIFDMGDAISVDNSHESNQEEFKKLVTKIIKKDAFVIGLGGGHGIAYGTFSGLRDAIKDDNKIGIINFDAHLDMRTYENGTSSGTMFKQIADENFQFYYMPIGIQKQGNTKRLFNIAKEYNVDMITFEDTITSSLEELEDRIVAFINKVDVVYVTFCMDVFDISDAPGVSAPSAIGIEKRLVLKLLKTIFNSKKVKAVDFAEVNPSLDIDDRTSRLVAYFIHSIIGFNF